MGQLGRHASHCGQLFVFFELFAGRNEFCDIFQINGAYGVGTSSRGGHPIDDPADSMAGHCDLVNGRLGRLAEFPVVGYPNRLTECFRRPGLPAQMNA